jgi:hypothetical protein
MFGRVFHFAPASKAALSAAMSPSFQIERMPPSMRIRFDTIGQRTDSEPIGRKLRHYLSVSD